MTVGRVMDRISVLAALPSMEVRSFLENISQRCRWQLRWCRSCAEICSQFESSPGVMLTADRLPDGDWKDVLGEVRRPRLVPPLIVASHIPDATLRSEVLHLGGYGVLTVPFLAQEVIPSVSMAGRRWHRQWILTNQGKVLMPSWV